MALRDVQPRGPVVGQADLEVPVVGAFDELLVMPAPLIVRSWLKVNV